MTTRLAVLRHGPTADNVARRLQGRRDTPLSAEGRAAVRRWRLPADLAAPNVRWVTSPLARARETAALLHPAGAGRLEVVPALIESDWGAWEGQRLADLRARDPVGMATIEARGLDRRPPGGESPRDVQARLRTWLRLVAEGALPLTVAVTHKGVIRALLALASGWDMTDDPPVPPRDACLHRFRLDPDGRPSIERLNEPLS